MEQDAKRLVLWRLGSSGIRVFVKLRPQSVSGPLFLNLMHAIYFINFLLYLWISSILSFMVILGKIGNLLFFKDKWAGKEVPTFPESLKDFPGIWFLIVITILGYRDGLFLKGKTWLLDLRILKYSQGTGFGCLKMF